MISDLIKRNEEEKMIHELQLKEFRYQMNLTIDSMNKKKLEKENSYQEGLESLKKVINYQKNLYKQVT